MRSAAAGHMPEVIVVAFWNTADRMREYSPWHWGPAYGRFLIEELMPEVNSEMRTRIGARHTTVMGSSLGGLISLDLCRRHPRVFDTAGCVSTAFELSEADVAGNPQASGQPLFLRDIERGLRFARGPRACTSTMARREPTRAMRRCWPRSRHG